MNDVTYMKNILFSAKKCENKEIVMNEDAKAIAVHAFSESIVEQVQFNKNLKIIKTNAFENSNLKELYLENDVILEACAFQNSKNIKNINIASRQIPFLCFHNCGINTNGMEIILKNTIIIRDLAFANCKIEKIILPNTLKKIGAYAFKNTQFKNKILILPESVDFIGDNVFSNSNLTDIFLPDSIEFLMFTNYTENKNFHMSEKLFKKLKLEEIPNIIVEKNLTSLIDSMSFKEVNKIIKGRERSYENSEL